MTFLEVFKRIGVNKPLLEDLKKNPKEGPLKVLIQAFLKKVHQELNGNMAPRQGTIDLRGSNYIFRAQKLPPKMKDPASFNIPCNIGGLTIDHALCNLGSSVNIIPIGLAHKLGIGEGQPTSTSIKFGDRALVQPKGLFLDVLVKVGGFLFPIDFYIMDIPEDPEIPIVLGRPLLATSQADINMKKGEMTLECMEEKLLFKASRVDLDSPQDCLALEDDKKKDAQVTHEDKENTPTINQEVPLIITFIPYLGVSRRHQSGSWECCTPLS